MEKMDNSEINYVQGSGKRGDLNTSEDHVLLGDENKKMQKFFTSLSKFISYLIAILFTIYTFLSIIEVNMQSLHVESDIIKPLVEPLAKRAVVIVSDGQRADMTFGKYPNGQYVSPNLQRIANQEGTYGISTANLPTESKIDISSILSGNSMDLTDLVSIHVMHKARTDLLLNESNFAFGIGTLEIVELYDNPEVYNMDKIDLVFQDFNYFKGLDCPENVRILELLDEYLAESKKNEEKTKNLNKDKVVFFIHFMCADNMGHMYRTDNWLYQNGLTRTDLHVQQVVDKINNFYQDDKTAFFFTADHGQEDAGVHGDANEITWNTPFIAWGAGIAKPVIDEKKLLTPEMNFGNPHLKRNDIHQLDIASLVATVIGIPIPKNSEGMLPVEYLNTDESNKAKGLSANAHQICSSILVLEHESSYVFMEKLDRITKMIEDDRYAEAENASRKIIGECLEVLKNLKQEQKKTSYVVFTVCYAIWVLFNLFRGLFVYNRSYETRINAHEPQKKEDNSFKLLMYLIWALFSLWFLIFIWKRDSPARFYEYAIFPILLSLSLIPKMSSLQKLVPTSKATYLWIAFILLAIYELSGTYHFYRLPLFAIFILWVLGVLIESRPKKTHLIMFLFGGAAFTYILLLTRINYIEPEMLKYSTLALALIVFSGVIIFRRKKKAVLLILGLGVLTVITAFVVENFDRIHPADKSRATNHLTFGKIVLFIGLLLPPIARIVLRPHLDLLLFLTFASFAPLVGIQALSFEPIAFGIFFILLFGYRNIERSRPKDQPQSNMERQSMMLLLGFVLLNQIAYFGMGNLATIDFFRIESGLRILADFDVTRFLLLIVLKVCLPYLMLNMFIQAILGQKFKRVARLFVNLALIGMANLVIYFYINLNKLNGRDLHLSIGFPLLITLIFVVNVWMAGVGNLLMWNTHH